MLSLVEPHNYYQNLLAQGIGMGLGMHVGRCVIAVFLIVVTGRHGTSTVTITERCFPLLPAATVVGDGNCHYR